MVKGTKSANQTRGNLASAAGAIEKLQQARDNVDGMSKVLKGMRQAVLYAKGEAVPARVTQVSVQQDMPKFILITAREYHTFRGMSALLAEQGLSILEISLGRPNCMDNELCELAVIYKNTKPTSKEISELLTKHNVTQ